MLNYGPTLVLYYFILLDIVLLSLTFYVDHRATLVV